MGEQTGISWCHHTQNFWIGCRKVSPACTHCYAGTFVKNRMGKPFYPEAGLGRVATDADSPVWRTKTWRDPLKWDRAAREAGEVRRVFTCSLSDFFLDHPQVHEWRREAWHVMRDTPNLLWLVLSKRWDLGEEYNRSCLPDDWGGGYPNVMLGATCETQETAARRLFEAVQIPCECGLFVSAEPLLGPLSLKKLVHVHPPGSNVLPTHLDALAGRIAAAGTPWEDTRSRVRWVIGGGESGSNARPTHPEWARALRDDAEAAGVPFHWKQWGCWVTEAQSPDDIVLPSSSIMPWAAADGDGGWSLGDQTGVYRVSVERAGRFLDGVLHDAGPVIP